jgi:hypothetical protein
MALLTPLRTDTLVSLAKVIAGGPADHEPAPGFDARLARPLVGGDVVSGGRVTAVLERTAVVALGGHRRGLARIPDVLVDPDVIEWVPKGRPRSGMWLGKPPKAAVADELVDQRRASDERARVDQGRRRRRQLEADRRPPAAPTGSASGKALDVRVGDDVDAVQPEAAGPSVELGSDETAPPAGRTEACGESLVSSLPAPPPPSVGEGDRAPAGGEQLAAAELSPAAAVPGPVGRRRSRRPGTELAAEVEAVVDDLLRVWRREAALAAELYSYRIAVLRLGRRSDMALLIDQAVAANDRPPASSAVLARRRQLHGELPAQVAEVVDELLRAWSREGELAAEVARYRMCVLGLERRAAAALAEASDG